MDRNQLKQYQALRREIVSLGKAIAKLEERALDIPTVLGKVSGSSHDWPYTQERISVQMDEPKEADMIARRMAIKRRRKEEAERMAVEIEAYIAGIPDSTDRQIFELTFLEGRKQREIAEMVHLEQSSISKRIKARLQLSYNS